MFFVVVGPWANGGGFVRSASVYEPEPTKLTVSRRDRLTLGKNKSRGQRFEPKSFAPTNRIT